jgi:hypothetical protein
MAVRKLFFKDEENGNKHADLIDRFESVAGDMVAALLVSQLPLAQKEVLESFPAKARAKTKGWRAFAGQARNSPEIFWRDKQVELEVLLG